jgi:glycosyltransferase involved in cell wall biosynthesis
MSEICEKGRLNGRPLRLIFYDDAPVYGGHEVMILNALRHLTQVDTYEILFIYSASNFRLESELKMLLVNCPRLSLVRFPYTSGWLQFLRTLWAVKPLRDLRKILRDFCPDCLVVVQGEISLSALGVLAGLRESIRTISYIPLAHTRQERGERLARMKDAVLGWYYHLPHHFITISDGMVRMLRERGAGQSIDIVENGVDLSALQPANKAHARSQLGIPQNKFAVALCGRIEFQQKGHDVLLRALVGRASDFSDWTFLVVGEGPDKRRLEASVEELGLSSKVKVIAWQSSMSLAYSAIDLVVMPSRYEGVPLVLLEAMHCGLPVVASAVGPMADLLPGQWLFPPGNSDALANAMLRVRSLDNESWLEINRQVVATRFTLERQQVEFANVLRRLMSVGTEVNGHEIGAPPQIV